MSLEPGDVFRFHPALPIEDTMNKVYRIVWSEPRRAFVVTQEGARAHGKPSSTRRSVVAAVAVALQTLGSGAHLPALLALGENPHFLFHLWL
jgi:hypothetical protein